jgi:hypothetical protein
VEGRQESIGRRKRTSSSLSHQTRAEQEGNRGIGASSEPSASEAAAASAEFCRGGITYRQGMGTSTSLIRHAKAPGDYHRKGGTEAAAQGSERENPS